MVPTSLESRKNIIICAALIDKIPNLGGLTKTCEFLNAEGLIIEAAEMVQNKDYLEITKGCEKSLPLFEIKERDLLDYLKF